MSRFKIREKNFISIIICFNEELHLFKNFLNDLNKLFSENFEKVEYIIINNSQKDITGNFKEELKGVSVKVINLSWKHNVEDAMRSGLDFSIGDYIFEFDSYMINYDKSLIMESYRKCLSGFDSVSISPIKKTNIASKLFYYLLYKFSKNSMKLNTEYFRIVSRRMINTTSTSNETFRYRKANYHYSGLNTFVIECESENLIQINDFSWTEKFSLASNILIYYTSIGSRISLMLSVFFMITSMAMGSYAIGSYMFKSNYIQEGWTTTILFLSISFSGIFAILTLFSKYLEILLKEIQINIPYTYKSIEHYEK